MGLQMYNKSMKPTDFFADVLCRYAALATKADCAGRKK